MAGTGFGFKPIRKLDGSPYNGAVEKGTVASSNSALFKYTPINVTSAGTWDLAATSAPIGGVAIGFEYSSGGTKRMVNNIAASNTNTVTVHYVRPENMVFEAMDAGGAAQTLVGNNADTSGTTGSTTTGLSTAAMGTAAASTAQWRIIGIKAAPNNAASSASNGTILEVVANETQLHVDAAAAHLKGI
jgi:hypothetical protein